MFNQNLISTISPHAFPSLPLLPGYTYNPTYVKTLRKVIYRALTQVNRVFAVRLDLRFPRFYEPGDGYTLDNGYIRRFFERLEQSLESDRSDAIQQGKQAHPIHLHYLWAREYDRQETRPHFHVVILLNRAAYRNLGKYEPGSRMLMTRAVEAWAGALGFRPEECEGLVHVPENPNYVIERDSGNGIPELFERVSYLCKNESKCRDGFHAFGSSRR